MEKNEVVGYFTEDNGNKSWMRAMCFAALLMSMFTGFLTIWKGDATGNGLYITLMFLVAAFAPKAVQKFAEVKIK